MGFKIQKVKTVEANDYAATLVRVDPSKGQFGPCLKFFFIIADGEFEGAEVSMIRPARLVAGNKLDRTLQSMGIDTSNIDDELDVDTLKGKTFKVKVENKTSAQGKVFANVTEILGASNVAPATTPVTTPVPVATPRPGVQTPNVEDVPF